MTDLLAFFVMGCLSQPNTCTASFTQNEVVIHVCNDRRDYIGEYKKIVVDSDGKVIIFSYDWCWSV